MLETEEAREVDSTPRCASVTLRALEAKVQRVNYRTGELTAIAEGRVWRFHVPADCQLRFNDIPTILRCFHPLDSVSLIVDAKDELCAIHLREAQAPLAA